MELTAALTQYAPELRARAIRMSKSPSNADDLVQETALRALRFQDQFQNGSNVRAWLHQILFSVFITQCRKNRRHKNATHNLEHDPVSWVHEERYVAVEQELSPAATAKLSALPPNFRDVIKLVDLEENSYRDAADTLAVPVGTVMSRLHRGRKLLATMFQEEQMAA
jgi:RNA polymerase sigma-70 factor, ECF subfamily